ncbi:sedoheptulokinase [Cohnella hashimotonis]|uniref:FGGY family carbohydrate kinase n=1 Tax=Cohnella hashimotonis TaxID=2826895 RepID=A0ABT6TMZ4_9BACL|nr:FGGY family carbohydrate kinase [Cohnella hashimotonis]MDI4648214.1 FGGY family carbohydrate kinase [Cohnella hashimotonis]
MSEFTENAMRGASGADKRYVIGLDIGTTSLCATAVDTRNGSAARTIVRPNHAAIAGEAPDERLQDPDRIADELLALLEEWRDLRPETAAIGISAQMHGILYVDGHGRAVSPLYTWQDGRGERQAPSGGTATIEAGAAAGTIEAGAAAGVRRASSGEPTYREQLETLSGYPVPSGYGLLTHDVLRRNGCVPEAAAKLCTVGDYVAMRLTDRPAPLMDATQAAGLGLFDLRSRSFDAAAVARAGIDATLLPALARPAGTRSGATPAGALVGTTPEGIPVAVAIGDNQASYLGTVPALTGSLLFNVGTGAQLSLYTPEPVEPAGGLELRPFPDGGWLLAGASLGGGKSYALLAGFYREIAETLGGGEGSVPSERLYDAMNRWALTALDEGHPLPRVDAAFFGTRVDPARAGEIASLTSATLTPQALTAGLLAGVADELAAFAAQLPAELLAGVRRHVGAGNGLRRNPALRRLLEQRIGAPLELADAREEAAFGAAVHAAVCAGIFTDYDEALTRMGGARLTEGEIV